MRCKEDYVTMGFSGDQAAEYLQIDESKEGQLNERRMRLGKKAPKGQTKEEQEAFLEKMKVYGNRDPEITAQSIDFGKSLDD